MDRYILVLALTLGWAIPGHSEPTPTPPPPLEQERPMPPKDRPPKPEGDRPKMDHHDGDDGMMQKFRKRMDQMSPEDRERFKANWDRWKQMSDQERADWKNRAMAERDRLRKVVDDAIAKLGLKLDDDQREVFALRYRQERRKLEQSLCQEMDAKRKAGDEEILQKLKEEFSAKPKAAPSPAATPQ